MSRESLVRMEEEMLGSPYLRWLPGFRSQTWWKQALALVFYPGVVMFMLFELATGRLAGLVAGGGLLLSAVAVPHLQSWLAARRPVRLDTIRLEMLLFPETRLSFPAGSLLKPWPKLVRRLHKRRQHLILVPLAGDTPSMFGCEAMV